MGLTTGLLWVVPLVAGGVFAPNADPQHVGGGDEVAVCGWPTVVRLSTNCSATLIHPQVVLYAGHCGAGPTYITTGEVSAEGAQYATSDCWVNPEWTGSPGGTDFAICRLAEPVLDIPIVPILMGCETQVLAPEVEATSVGFGIAPDGPNGIKRVISYPIMAVNDEENIVTAGGGDDDGTLCSGDSGGGSFVVGLDGSWRLFGVNSAVAGQPCVAGASVLAMAASAVPWIEEQTGFDVSPCYAADGTWEPDDRCTEVPIDPGMGGGDWPSCESGPLSGALSTCGVPFEGVDRLAPSIAITDPMDGDAVDPMGEESVLIPITIDVGDPGGFGVAMTSLRIDGRDVPGTEDDWAPFEVPTLTFPEGTYSLQAVATDWAGNEGVSAPVVVTVGEPTEGDSSGDGGGESSGAPADGPGDQSATSAPAEDSGDGGGTVALDGTTGVGQDVDDDTAGCSCRSERYNGAVGLWVLFMLGALRRRSAAHENALVASATDQRYKPTDRR